jgi:hypothetical protein
MFFFLPFAAVAQTRPASAAAAFSMLPRRHSRAAESRALGDKRSDIAELSVDLVRRALISFTASLTALGSRTNALFAQTAAALALDRATRDTASSFGLSWPGFGSPALRPACLDGTWLGQSRNSIFLPPFVFQGLTNPWASNPWNVLTEALDAWMKFWAPGAAEPRPYSYGARKAAAPITTNFPMPGHSWFTWGS